MTNTETKAVGYIRVSTDEQARNGQSLHAQEASIRDWGERAHISIMRVFEDAGVSGTKLRQRPALQNALRLSCEQKTVLVVYSLSRLSRSTKDTLQIAEKLHRAGADLVSLSEKIDTTSAAGKMVFRMLAVLNEFERDQISERTSAILQHKKAKGEVYSPIPYGFRRDGSKLLEDDKEQEVVQQITRNRKNGQSLRSIANELNSRGIPAKKGGIWYASTIRCILDNSLHEDSVFTGS